MGNAEALGRWREKERRRRERGRRTPTEPIAVSRSLYSHMSTQVRTYSEI